MDNGEGIDCGLQGWGGWRGANGKKWDNCNRISNKKGKNKIKNHLLGGFNEIIHV